MHIRRVLVCAAALIGMAGGSVLGENFTRVTGSGAPVPGQGTAFTAVNLAGVDAAAGAAFIGSFSLGGQNYSGLYQQQAGATTPLADLSTPGPSGETITSIIAAGDYDAGVIVFAAETTAGRALYRHTAGQGLTALVREGDLLPGSSAPISTFYNRGVAGDADNFSFGTRRTDNTSAIFTSVDNAPMQAVDHRIRVPIAEMGYFIDFPELHYRNGKTAFVGRGADPDWPGPGPAPIEPAGVFIATPGNPLDIVAGRFFPIPGAPENMRFQEFERPRIMPDGRVAFAGGFIDEHDPNPAAPHHMGVFIRNPDLTWKKYIDSEMILPGLRAETHEFNQYSLETGWNFFGVNDINGGSYIYYESADGVFTHLIDTYDPLDGKALTRIRMLSDTAVGGQLFFRADFTDGTSGIYTVTVPEPAAMLSGALVLLLLPRRRCRP